MINGEDTASGTALLIAAAPAGKHCLIDATSVLPTLAAVPTSILTGTTAATIVELADPTDPQTVLTRIRAAAAAPGPLSLYITGQLHLDRKQRLLHLALARTTPTTLRYTGLPWHWLAGELKLRRPGTTTVVIDVVAAPDAWQQLRTEGLALGYGMRVYGRVTPPPRRRIAEPTYLKALATTWRSGLNPPLAQLHEQAAAQAGPDDALFLAVDYTAVPTPAASAVQVPNRPHKEPAPVPIAPAPVSVSTEVAEEDPLPAIIAATRAGRHGEAASLAAMWEEWALRTHGADSVQATHWLEVRADLARLADDPALSCELWMAAANARLARQQPPGDPTVEDAVDRAHHQWQELFDPQRARELGPLLVSLRRHVPGRRPGAVEAVQRRLELLHTMPPSGHDVRHSDMDGVVPRAPG
ncbi:MULTISPECIES: hypothetical protein [unclassified Streptomyces]|uniref:hypothetical protein n=1 Tax=unclassified Streptomyces TaxID=2593676 RepID=UPI002256351F|nr:MULTISPECIES: hypothetical protein [unclassified Streptomyces]WSP60234.1 hypothetical protein OG306_28690 [Streptomyces sp. NBC_01241]WSU26365.1 hypothetical protein OG508_10420 [Streptomyces sp. NBC_01108]MCX4794471.1 hypothetical protein [Streptomyces sp. NBC_01242]WSJ40945.1 hypothetical protein OG772_06990 [Streptomyces sp. NBC_01321]WSP67278.1 hypothetical protein OG466_10440 [Streptomyces sp. NBC_01240]